MADASDPRAVVDAGAAATLAVVAFLSGLTTRPLLDRLAVRLVRWVKRRRATQHELLESLQRMLPELQKVAEASRDVEAYRRCLSLNLEIIEIRDRLASSRIRDVVGRYQNDAMELAELYRTEAESPPLVGDTGEVSGEQALGRVHTLLLARQSAWESLAQVLARISGDLRRG